MCLGLLHRVLKKVFHHRTALLVTVLLTAITSLVDLTSSLGLVGLLHKRSFSSEALTILLVEYSALPALATHFFYQMWRGKETWTPNLCELFIALIFLPLAPIAGHLVWALKICQKEESDRAHKFCALLTTIQGVVVSPLMVSAISFLYLTECITPPWHETTIFCDSLSNCVSLGPLATYVPLVRFALSLVTVFTGFFDARQTRNKFHAFDFLAFAMPNSIFRVSTLLLIAAALKEYALYLLLLVVLVNIAATAALSKKLKNEKDNNKNTNQPQGGISIPTSALCSIVGVSTIPEDPAERDKNPGLEETPQDLKKINLTAIATSLTTLPLFLLANIAVHLLIQSADFDTNPNNILNNEQTIYILKYGLYPLAVTALSTTMIFGSSLCFSQRKGVRWARFALNLITTLSTLLGLIVLAVRFPVGPSKVVLAIQTRDRINFVDGFTWSPDWEASTNHWTWGNGTLNSLDGKTLEEIVMKYPHNLNKKNISGFCSRTTLGQIIEESSGIKLVKPYPPSTDDTSDVSCVSCADKESNYCRRLLQDVLEQNPHLVQCSKAVDGWWSEWTEGKCRTAIEVSEGFSCGNGWQMKTRECIGRRSGGKYCTGKPSSLGTCFQGHCPGLVFLN